MKFCKNCGSEVNEKADVCVNCGCSLKKKKPLYKKWWFWVIIVVLIISVAAGSSGSGDTSQPDNTGANQTVENNAEQTVSKANDKFNGECGISASAEMGSSIIGMPTLTVSISNTYNIAYNK